MVGKIQDSMSCFSSMMFKAPDSEKQESPRRTHGEAVDLGV